jgi:hypothetical protein
MTIERIVTAFAGVVILVTLGLYMFMNIDWMIYVTAFVGFNLLQSSFTGFCPLVMVLKAMGVKSEAEKASA